MKKFKVIAVLAIAFCFLFGTTTVYGYDIGLTVSGGNGTIEGSIAGTDTITVSTENSTINGLTVVPPSDKYFMRGVKIAGHDNDELYTGEVSINTPGTSFYNKDTAMVVAYGLKSDMVQYTIQYLDRNGAELLPAETHYGVINDNPVVSYKYIDGYLPDAYNATKRLSGNPADNIIKFTYSQVQAAEGQTIINNTGNAGGGNAGGNAAGGNAAGNAAGNAGANAAAPGTATIGDAPTPQAINDQNTPLAANPDEEEGGGPGAFPFIIGGVIAAAIIAAIAAVLARRKGEETE